MADYTTSRPPADTPYMKHVLNKYAEVYQERFLEPAQTSATFPNVTRFSSSEAAENSDFYTVSKAPYYDRNAAGWSTFTSFTDVRARRLSAEKTPLLAPDDSVGSPPGGIQSPCVDWDFPIGLDKYLSNSVESIREKLRAKPCTGFPDVFRENSKHHTFDYVVGDGGLQRQYSGSSFSDSLFSSDVPLSNLSHNMSFSTSESNLLASSSYGLGQKDKFEDLIEKRSWAQQTELTYKLQLAVALRVVKEAGLADELTPLPSFGNDSTYATCSGGAASIFATVYRFWDTGTLRYGDRIDDGFYHICGMNSHIWSLCNDVGEKCCSRIPTLQRLRTVNPSDTSMEVIIIDKHEDSRLCKINIQAFHIASKTTDSKELAALLGKLVSESMGGAAGSECEDLWSRYQASSTALRECLNCIVLPIGSISVGVCRHRALLFKALADRLGLPCCIARGCKYCGQDDGISCLVSCAGREFLVDLISCPGELTDPGAFLKNQPVPQIRSPLRLPELRFLETVGNSQSDLVKNITLGEIIDSDSNSGHMQQVQTPFEHKSTQKESVVYNQGAVPNESTQTDKEMSLSTSCPSQSAGNTSTSDHNQSSSMESTVDRPKRQLIKSSGNDTLFPPEQGCFTESDKLEEKENENGDHSSAYLVNTTIFEQSLALEGLEIAWDELHFREKIGEGSFGTVHRADWKGTDVAVKILQQQDYLEERYNEFMKEIAILKRVRHPNVVLFMGAVTKHSHLSIVTEFLPRGNLFDAIKKYRTNELRNEKRRLRIALDVAKGINYLHTLTPPIVHRDLKSQNILVDKNWNAKVCDFGLSKLKTQAFVSRSLFVGTTQYMAPEILKDEASNEKADIYSFGVILWELFTLKQPWEGLGPPQVIAAVAYEDKRLTIPSDIRPEISSLIDACLRRDPDQRPTLLEIMNVLKRLLKSQDASAVGPDNG